MNPFVDLPSLAFGHQWARQRTDLFHAARPVAQFHKQCRHRIELMQAIERRIVGDVSLLDRRQEDARADSRVDHHWTPSQTSDRIPRMENAVAIIKHSNSRPKPLNPTTGWEPVPS